MQTCPFALSVRARSDTHYTHISSLLSCLVLSCPATSHVLLAFLETHLCSSHEGWSITIFSAFHTLEDRHSRHSRLSPVSLLFFLLPFTGAGPPKKNHFCKMSALPCSYFMLKSDQFSATLVDFQAKNCYKSIFIILLMEDWRRLCYFSGGTRGLGPKRLVIAVPTPEADYY